MPGGSVEQYVMSLDDVLLRKVRAVAASLAPPAGPDCCGPGLLYFILSAAARPGAPLHGPPIVRSGLRQAILLFFQGARLIPELTSVLPAPRRSKL